MSEPKDDDNDDDNDETVDLHQIIIVSRAGKVSVDRRRNLTRQNNEYGPV